MERNSNTELDLETRNRAQTTNGVSNPSNISVKDRLAIFNKNPSIKNSYNTVSKGELTNRSKNSQGKTYSIEEIKKQILSPNQSPP